MITAIAVFGLLALFLISLRMHSWTNELPSLKVIKPREPGTCWPRISLIVPACNEAAAIGPALRSFLGMDYPDLEIIVVNDRSTDATGKIIDEVGEELASRQESRSGAGSTSLKQVKIESLPAGWLGKVHALHQGAQEASGDWLLFSDADVHYGYDSLKKAYTYCIDHNLDFLNVVPGIKAQGIWLRACIAQFMQTVAMATNLRKVPQASAPDRIGGGAFNMVRRESFVATPGFPWLRLEVIDDLGLATLMKACGARCGVAGGKNEISLEWYPDLKSLVKGLEKNGFAFFQYSWFLLISYLALNWLLLFSTFAAPLLAMSQGNAELIGLGLAATLSLFFLAAIRLLRATMEFPPWVGFLLPVIMTLFPLVALRSALLFTKDGGIRWRQTFYARHLLVGNQRVKLLGDFFLRLRRKGRGKEI